MTNDQDSDLEKIPIEMAEDIVGKHIIIACALAEEEARAKAKKYSKGTRLTAFICFCIVMVVGKNWETSGDTGSSTAHASVHAGKEEAEDTEEPAQDRPTVTRTVGKRALYTPEGQPQTRVSLLEGKCDPDLPMEVCEKLPEDPASLNGEEKVQVFTASPWKPVAPNTVSRRTQHEIWNGDALDISWELESQNLGPVPAEQEKSGGK